MQKNVCHARLVKNVLIALHVTVASLALSV